MRFGPCLCFFRVLQGEVSSQWDTQKLFYFYLKSISSSAFNTTHQIFQFTQLRLGMCSLSYTNMLTHPTSLTTLPNEVTRQFLSSLIHPSNPSGRPGPHVVILKQAPTSTHTHTGVILLIEPVTWYLLSSVSVTLTKKHKDPTQGRRKD